MIKKITIFLVLVLLLAVAGRFLFSDMNLLRSLPASDKSGNTIWEYETDENGTLLLTAYSGRDDSVTVPESIDGIPVASLGDGVFAGNTRLKTILIPDQILIEGKGVFENFRL